MMPEQKNLGHLESKGGAHVGKKITTISVTPPPPSHQPLKKVDSGIFEHPNGNGKLLYKSDDEFEMRMCCGQVTSCDKGLMEFLAKSMVSFSVLGFCFLQLSQGLQSEFASSTISLILLASKSACDDARWWLSRISDPNWRGSRLWLREIGSHIVTMKSDASGHIGAGFDFDGVMRTSKWADSQLAHSIAWKRTISSSEGVQRVWSFMVQYSGSLWSG